MQGMIMRELRGYLNIIEELLYHGAVIHVRDRNGITALI